MNNAFFQGYLAMAALLIVACGSGSDNDDDAGPTGSAGSPSGGAGSAGAPPQALAGFPQCPGADSFLLTGDVDGEAIEVTEAPTLGGFSQQSNPPGPHFSLPNPNDVADDQLIQVYFTWPESVASNEVTPIEGWVRLPPGPLAGETICAGPGSEMVLPQDEDTYGDLLFRMRGLARGVDCDQPVSGELDGCWHN